MFVSIIDKFWNVCDRFVFKIFWVFLFRGVSKKEVFFCVKF